MQCLTASRDLYYVYNDEELGQTGKGYYFNDVFRDFLIEMRESSRDVITPHELFRAILKKWPRFRGYQVSYSHYWPYLQQQDSHDLLMNLFDLLEKEATKKKEEPLTQLVFGGEICSSGKVHQPHTSIVLCLTCNNVSRTIDPFNNLMLEIQFRSSHSKLESLSHLTVYFQKMN